MITTRRLFGDVGTVVDGCVTVMVAVPARIVPVRVAPVVFVLTLKLR